MAERRHPDLDVGGPGVQGGSTDSAPDTAAGKPVDLADCRPPTRHPLVWETQTQVVQVVLKLTEREANDLYTDIYRLDRDVPGAQQDYPLIHSVYDALYQAGVDGTR